MLALGSCRPSRPEQPAGISVLWNSQECVIRQAKPPPTNAEKPSRIRTHPLLITPKGSREMLGEKSEKKMETQLERPSTKDQLLDFARAELKMNANTNMKISKNKFTR